MKRFESTQFEDKSVSKMTKKRFEAAQVGDEVMSVIKGTGTITKIGKGEYPIVVTFLNNRPTTYTLEGFNHTGDLYPELFLPDGYKPPVNGKESQRLPDLPVDTKVIVWNFNEDKFKRHFNRWSKDGKCKTFPDGQTLFSSNDSNYSITWDHWELAEKGAEK